MGGSPEANDDFFRQRDGGDPRTRATQRGRRRPGGEVDKPRVLDFEQTERPEVGERERGKGGSNQGVRKFRIKFPQGKGTSRPAGAREEKK